jgi:hypothetical protein
MGERRGLCRFWWRNLREEGVDGRVVLKTDRREGGFSMDWIDLAQERDRWRAVVNVVMKCREFE